MAQVRSIEKYEVDSFISRKLGVVMAGKADHFDHAETQDSQNDLESSQLESFSCSQIPADSQVAEPAPEDSQSGLSQDTLQLASPSPDQPEENEEEIPQEEDEEESDGRLTPPVGFVLSSDGRVHGDTSMVQDNPMLAMIMNAMSGVLAQKRLEEHEDEMERKGKGKGKVGAKGAEGNGYDAGTGSSSSITAPMSKPKAKSKSKSMAKKGKIGKKH